MEQSISPFLQAQLIAQYGEVTAAQIVVGYGAARLTTLRVNRLKAEPQAVREALAAAGIAAEGVPWSADALVLSSEGAQPQEVRARVTALPLYERGEVYLQSLSSMLPPLLLGAQPGENVLDMAAAPGGKTTQIAALTGNGAMITACERNVARCERLRFNLDRQGAQRVTVMNMDARQLDDLFAFDRILLDAPCSGSGTVQLGESSRARFDKETLARVNKTQEALLRKALRLLRPGHELVYSTCSILEMENEGLLRRVLPGAQGEIVPIDAAAFPGVPLLPTTLPGTLCVMPDARYEGFFAARIRKKGK